MPTKCILLKVEMPHIYHTLLFFRYTNNVNSNIPTFNSSLHHTQQHQLQNGYENQNRNELTSASPNTHSVGSVDGREFFKRARSILSYDEVSFALQFCLI